MLGNVRPPLRPRSRHGTSAPQGDGEQDAGELTRKTTRVRYDESTITDTLCMLAADAYLRLVHDAGWPVERYQDWLADALLRLFLD